MWTDSDVGSSMLTCLSNNKSITIGVSESFMLSSIVLESWFTELSYVSGQGKLFCYRDGVGQITINNKGTMYF